MWHPLDDIDLGAAIAAELRLYAPSCSIVVGVTHGVVTLEGDAAMAERRDAIEAVVRGFAGVREVVNLITVPAVAAKPPRSHVDFPASESQR